MQVPVHVQARIEADVKKYVKMAEVHFGRSYPRIHIRYDVRGTTAGYAEGSNVVRFNPVLLMENLEDYITRTVPHEVAHCIDDANGDNKRPKQSTNDFLRMVNSGKRIRRAKRSVHGPTWKHIMHVFRIDDDSRCHQYDVTNSRVKTKAKFEYKCGTCTKSILVSSVIHNRLQRGREYWCKKCGRGSKLNYVQSLGMRTFQDAEKVRDARQQGWNQAMQKLGATTFPTKTATPIPQPEIVSQMDRARECYNTYRGVSRKEMIDIFVQRLGMKATTASTYYNSLKD